MSSPVERTCDQEFALLLQKNPNQKGNLIAMGFLIVILLVFLLYLSYKTCLRRQLMKQTTFTNSVIGCVYISILLSLFQVCCWIAA